MSEKQFATFSIGDPFSIKMKGDRDFVLDRVLRLTDDFENPEPWTDRYEFGEDGLPNE